MHPALEGAAEQAAAERGEFDSVMADLEARLKRGHSPAAALRRVRDIIERAGSGPDALTFGEKRLALRALGVRVRANGPDPSDWRYEMGVPRRG